MSNFTSAQLNALNSLSPRLKATGVNLGDLIDEIMDQQTAGNLGIASDAGDVDSLALGGGHFSQDDGTTTGLTFGYGAGRFHNGLAEVPISAGTLLLANSTTNYVEVNRAGTVSSNTSGFTSGSLPLYLIVTGVSTITSVTSKKPLLQLIGTAGVVGSMLSTVAGTKSAQIAVASIAATTSFTFVAPCTGTLTLARIADKDAVTADDTNYWTFAAKNKSNSSVDLLDTSAVNTTKSTGGAAISAYTKRDLTLTGTGGNLAVTKGDVIEVTITKTASATTMTEFVFAADFTFTN